MNLRSAPLRPEEVRRQLVSDLAIGSAGAQSAVEMAALQLADDVRSADTVDIETVTGTASWAALTEACLPS